MQSNTIRSRTASLTFLVGISTLLAMSDGAAAGELTLAGDVTNPGNYSIDYLKSLQPTTVDGYIGVSLWTLLGDGSDVIVGTGKNAILRNYVVATGSNGSQSLVSLGEIDPQFGGNPSQPDLVAYERNGQLLSSPQLIVPQDTSGARNVTNLASLNVLSVPQAPTGPGGYSTQFTVSVPGNVPVSVDLNTLKSFPSVIETVSYQAGGMPVTQTFTGVPVWNLLSQLQLGATQNDILTKYLTATGSDGYKVFFSLAEFDPNLGAPAYPMEAIVAYADSNGPLIDSGFARLVIPGDNFGGRFVSNLVNLEVVNAVPEPTSALLLISGLAAIALLTWSQNRSSARAA
jgi:uncharacterized protein (DUF433 family)